MAKNKNKEKLEIDFISCEKCQGTGFSSDEKKCPTCEGRGVFLVVGKGTRFFWGKKLIGSSVLADKINSFFGGVTQFIFSFLTLITSLYGIYFIIINNKHFWEAFTSGIQGVVSDSDIMHSWFDFIFSFSGDILLSFWAVMNEKSLGALVFWLAVLTCIISYYRMKISIISQKRIHSSDPALSAFYDLEAPAYNNPVDISVYASPRSIRVIDKALNYAHDLKQEAGIFHLAKVLIDEDGVKALMNRIEVDHRDFYNFIDENIKKIGSLEKHSNINFFTEVPMGAVMKKITLIAFEEALIAGFDKIETECLFLTLLYDESFSEYFNKFKIEDKDIRTAVLWSKTWSSVRLKKSRPRRMKKNIMNKAWTARVTPELDRFSYDMTNQARYGITGPVVNRFREIDNLMRILERVSQNNALLIGEEGSGRSSIVRALANRMIHDEVLPSLRDKRLVVLDIGALVSGARAGGDLELRVREVLDDAAMSGNIIFYIPDIHNIAAAGSGEGFDVSKVLSPILSQNIFQVIGSTDYKNYHRYIESRSDFANNFDMIKVEELSEEDTLKVVAINAGLIEAREGVVMTYGAIKKSVELSKRYITDKLLPGKAVDLLAETAVEARKKGEGAFVKDEDVMEVITDKTGIPLRNIAMDEADKLLHLEENLHERVIGQDSAVKAVASAIRRVRVGMKMENRPVGVFLFLGPTGVGKTELAKALAELYYGDESSMIRLDMSEYQTIESAEKLIGYSSDRAESGMGGILTEAVKKQPFSLVLLDELEKAHKNILNLFLQVFDDGRLTDSLGRTVDFTNTIIIATSNAGSKVMHKMFAEDGSDNNRMMDLVSPYLLEYFSPEFMNRFTDKIIFHSLDKENLANILELQIKNVSATLKKAQGIDIELTPPALSYLLEIGYSAEYGARFMQRAVQEKLENLIAVEFLKGNIKRGDKFKVNLEDLRNI